MMENIYIGIDPSYANTGIIGIDDACNIVVQDCVYENMTGKGLEAMRARCYLSSMINTLIPATQNKNIFIGIEYPMVAHKGASPKVQEAFALSAAATMLVEQSNLLEVYSVTPYEWRKYHRCKHNAKMRDVADYISDKYQVEFPNFDLYMAYGIARYVRVLSMKGQR